MREDYNDDSLRVISFEEMHRFAHEEGVISADKMALIMTTDMGFTHCYRSDSAEQYRICNAAGLEQQAGNDDLIRLR